MKIVLVTSSQPSLNPRLVKEADVLAEQGYEVVVIGQYWNSWATSTDKVLLEKKDWQYIRVGGSPEDEKLQYSISRAVHKFCRKIRDWNILRFNIAELSMGRCSYQLYREAKRQKADLYIGHNPGGLAPAVLAAKHTNAKCGFDAEDFHRSEYSDDPTHPDVLCKSYLEHKYFPLCDYIITSSPLISQEYKKIFPSLDFGTILNVFPTVEDLNQPVSKAEDPVRLFWFSQTIGVNRGLDEAIEAMRILKNSNIELHALGYPREQAVSYYKELATRHDLRPSQLTFYPPIPPDDIYHFAAQFDIGLATEIGIPYNRRICLTNKIFTYIQSGLAVLASDTPAQQYLLDQYPGCGLLFRTQDANSLAVQISKYLDERELLRQAKQTSLSYGQRQLNWEVECRKFIIIVERVLGNKP